MREIYVQGGDQLARALFAALFAVVIFSGAAHSVPVSTTGSPSPGTFQPMGCNEVLIRTGCGHSAGARPSGLPIQGLADTMDAKTMDADVRGGARIDFVPAGERGDVPGKSAAMPPSDSGGIEPSAIQFFADIPVPLCATPLCAGSMVSALPGRPDGMLLAAALPLVLGGLAALGALGIRPER